MSSESGNSLSNTPTRIPPSVLMLGISAPMFARAYVVYNRPLDGIFEKIAKRNSITVNEITKEADIGVRRACGMMVAGRALSLASYLSLGSFGMFGAAVFFTMGWNSFEEGISATRRWGNSKRKNLDKWLVFPQRVDEDHPDVIARKAMTCEQESEYLANRYWKIKSKDVDATPEKNREE